MRAAPVLIVIFAAILSFPYFFPSPYLIHIGTLIFIFSFITTAWSYMGRFGLVSLGHGAFLGIGAYTSGLLFNYYGLSPWIGMILGGAVAVLFAMIIGYACFRFGVIGDYFALVTLALGEVVALTIIAFRDITGGSLGFTLKSMGTSLLYLQSEHKIHFYYISLGFLILSLLVWKWIDRSKMQKALRAIGEDEIAASTLGVGIIRYKVIITSISAFTTAIGGVLVRPVHHLSEPPYSGGGAALPRNCFQGNSGRNVQPLGAGDRDGFDCLFGGIFPGGLWKHVRGIFADHLRSGSGSVDYLPSQRHLRKPPEFRCQKKEILRPCFFYWKPLWDHPFRPTRESRTYWEDRVPAFAGTTKREAKGFLPQIVGGAPSAFRRPALRELCRPIFRR